MTAPIAEACWSGSNARDIFVTEALEGDDAIFLATHTPIRGFTVDGRSRFEIQSADEFAVLETLSNAERTHAFCVVQGEPGSGKSHLVRWLSINWPSNNDVKLLLRRADGSLRGALEQLKLQLPVEFTPLFDNLGRHHAAAFQGRANIFLSTLADTLQPDHYEKPFPDRQWCKANLPGELLSHSSVKTNWQGPQRILRLLEGGEGSRNSASASFNLFDIRDLAKVARVRGTGVRPETEGLANRLKNEANAIDEHEAENWLASELAEQRPEQFKFSLALMEALNRRRNDAIQNVLGISSSALKGLFRSVRQELQKSGRRLVLLLEDITSWEGLDDSLIDVLVENADASADAAAAVCPLISVVGVTPAYYRDLQANYRQRITHEIKLGESQSGLQDVSTLREKDARATFVVRYLSAVRAGHAKLRLWRAQFRADPDLEPPNACETCPRQAACFDVFDQVDGVGLFPFTRRSIERMFDALKENDNGQTWKTPRGVIQAILSPSLNQPELLAAGTYPSPFIESTAMRDDRKSTLALSNRLDRILEHKISEQSQRDRMRRVLAYWADPDSADTTEENGHLLFAGAKQGIFDAFGLPWIGESAATAPSEQTEEPAGELNTPPPPQDDAEEPRPAPSSSHQKPSGAASHPRVPRPPRLGKTASQQESLRNGLRKWASGGALENGNDWNRILHELLSEIDLRNHGYPKAIASRLLTPERVKLQGTTSGGRNNLSIGPEAWVRDGLEAHLAFLHQASVLSASDVAFHRRNSAVFMRRLADAARGYLDARIPKLATGARWSLASTFAQILLARAWLRGSISPTYKLHEMVAIILSDEDDAASDPKARCLPWQEFLTATDKWHERFRNELRSIVSLPIGDGTKGEGFTDVSEIGPAILRMLKSGQSDDVPPADNDFPEEWRKASELCRLWASKARLIERTEMDQLRRRCITVNQSLRTNSIRHHLDRVDSVVTKISASLPEASADRVLAWKKAYERAGARSAEGADGKVEELISAFEDSDAGVPPGLADRLAWLARAPARAIEDYLDASQRGEEAIQFLHGHVSACIDDAGGADSIEEVRSIGRRLKAAAEGTNAALRTSND